MDSSRFALATLVGSISLFVLGYLIWGFMFVEFFANNEGSASGVLKDPPAFLWLALGQVSFAVFLTLVVGSWAGARTAVAGLKAGAAVGILIGLGIDLTLYATTNVSNLTAALVDPILVTVQVALTSAIIGLVLGRKGGAANAQA